MDILIANILDENQINEVKKLQNRCNKIDGLKNDAFLSNELNFRKDIPCFYLAYEGKNLVSFLTTFMPTSSEAEIIAFTDTEYRKKGYFTSLLEEARYIIKSASVTKILFVVESNSKSGDKVIKRYSSAKCNHSEYTLSCVDKINKSINEELCTKLVDANIKENYLYLAKDVFNLPAGEYENFVQHTIDAIDRDAYIVYYNDLPIGIFNINFKDNVSFIYSLGLVTSYRRRGYGKKLLNIALNKAFEGSEKVLLDVDSNNLPAYNLYTNNGFNVEYQVDYYSYNI
ncbi:GNAT family N-acetyltransferase [Romboutsia weinsteinii]|uniref:GNAT family N-acetyltransferase n=1 Tax=Romboutsia weinsteinii TaxID=2020949 RepID=A0A371J5G0_9FIRM|nr:GNAT family N-acetyltransferase [Romboutsia weinsteinii]RDY28031.1 GNAT family N-acetyltransferase [Romboutsia weinsteinii]